MFTRRKISIKKTKEKEDESKILKNAKNDLKKKILHRQASLTSAETSFLSLLLGGDMATTTSSSASSLATEEPNGSSINDDNTAREIDEINSARDILSNDMLFQIPMLDNTPIWTKSDANVNLSNDLKSVGIKEEAEIKDDIGGKRREALMRRKSRHLRLSLWKAHKDGVMPSVIKRCSPKTIAATSDVTYGESFSSQIQDDDEDDDDAHSTGVDSTEEVRKERDDEHSVSTSSSWNDSQGGYTEHNAWEVLKDEYAADFGFAYQKGASEGQKHGFIADDELDVRHFQIVGTSVNDKSSRPHVLSPPLMESLLNFLPESLIDTNYWLKYSLIRDGASLSTLKRYVRAAEHTIIAIETIDGNVFGSFTSSHWKTHPVYYGSGEAFLWKMRRSRNTPCHSLVDQAVLESEVDVHPFSGLNTYVQLCMSDKIAIGGGKLDTTGNERHGDEIEPDTYSMHHHGLDYGFGLSIDKFLDRGTSNPCATFRNPCLSNRNHHSHHHNNNNDHRQSDTGTDAFEIANLEVWGFTPCGKEKEAQKLELSKFFLHASRDNAISLNRNNRYVDVAQTDLFSNPEQFYRRVGDDDDVDQRWDDFMHHVDDDIMHNAHASFTAYRT